MELFKLFGTIIVDNNKANKAIDSTEKTANRSGNSVAGSFKKIGKAVATGMSVASIIAFGKKCVETAASVKASNSQYEQTFGDMEKDASKAMHRVAKESGIMVKRLQDSGTKIYAFAKTTGMDSANSLKLMERALQVSADSAAYYDRSLEDTTETLQSFLKGNYENDSALGLSCTETTRNTAANKLYGKSFKDLSESQKQLTLLQMVEDANKLSGAMGQAARESDGFENVMGNMKEAIRQVIALIGAPILSMVIPGIQKVTVGVQNLGNFIKNFDQNLKDNQSTINSIIIVVGTLTAAIVGFKSAAMLTSVIQSFQQAQLSLKLFTASQGAANIAQAAFNGTLTLGETLVALLTGKVTLAQLASQGWTVAQGALNAVLAANPIGVVVVAITALVGAFVLAYNKCEWFRNMVNSAFNAIKNTTINVFNAVKNAIVNPMETAKNFVKSVIDKIKGFFDFEISWPNIPLPHFDIKPDGWNIGDLLKGKIPYLDIEWYANGGIMDGATPFGLNPRTGKMMVGGEAGPEAIAPLRKLEEYYKKWSSAGNNEMISVLEQIKSILSDDNRWYRLMLRALTDGSFAIVLDGREVGRIVRKYA